LGRPRQKVLCPIPKNLHVALGPDEPFGGAKKGNARGWPLVCDQPGGGEILPSGDHLRKLGP